MEKPVSVAIVEDEKDSAIKLKKYLEKYAEENALKVETAAFSCGENFLSSQKKFDVVFMDIEMPGDDGLKVVKTLRSEGSDALNFRNLGFKNPGDAKLSWGTAE